LEKLKSFDFNRNTILFRAGDPLNSLNVANALYESGQVIYSYPNWLRIRTTRAIPNDTLFNDQWHLRNTGQGGGVAGEDVNITPVWDTYQASSNEIIAIVDDGLEISHEDLSQNVIPGLSWDWVDEDTDPTAEIHGTSVAGVAAARGFNNQGVTGAAPLAGLVGHRLLYANTDANEADALTRNKNLIDIYSNSWGPFDEGWLLEGPGPLTEDAIKSGVTYGRGGLGNIYVWAGGNGEYNGDNSNYDGYANSRYTIAVAASNNFGTHAGYSEKGANILLNAPSSGGPSFLSITTTDRTGSLGYSNGNYTNAFGGTSSAAPLVSGIIALMLQANPNLTWRDVKHILIKTAEKNDPIDANWTTNGAGYNINHKYGFGRIDALAAVNAAFTWTSVGSETSTQGNSNPNLPIPDNNSTGVTDTINISEDIKVEFVEVYFTSADHTYWGDLEITLISPNGTESVLAESHYLEEVYYTYNNWRFGSVRHFGESSIGNWTLRVRDLAAQDIGTFQSWTLKLFGTSAVPYANFYEELVAISFDSQSRAIVGTIVVKQPGIYDGNHVVACWVDWDNDGVYQNAYATNEYVGAATRYTPNPGSAGLPVSYGFTLPISPPPGTLNNNYNVKCVLTWMETPTNSDYNAVWGNALEGKIHIDSLY
jgi:kexin